MPADWAAPDMADRIHMRQRLRATMPRSTSQALR
jgi:hypothetical protein